MFAGEWNVLSRPNNKVVGPNGVLEGGTVGAGVFAPSMLDGLALWLDAIDQNSLLASDGSVIEDGEAVALWSDKSGNSAENYLILNASSGNYASAPDSVAISVTGDIECTASKASLTSVAGGIFGIFGTFLGKWRSSDSNRSFRFLMGLSGTMRLQVSTDGTFSEGTTGYTFTSDASANLSSNSYFKWSLDLDNGLGTAVAYFFESQDGITWSQVGGDISYGSTISGIYDSPAVLTIGLTNPSSPADIFGGRIGGITLKSGIDGTTVFDADFTAQPKLATSFTESSSNAATVTINTTGATGARISGARDLYQGTVANRPVFLKYNGEKYGYLNDVSGNYFGTPDSAALDITGDIDLIAKISLDDWTPSGEASVLTKYLASGNQRSYGLVVSSAGQIGLRYSLLGSDNNIVVGNALSLSDGDVIWIRATRESASGDVAFYSSTNGETWTARGTASTSAGDLYSSSAAINIGSINAGAALLMGGRVYRAIIKDGIDGTAVADFNAQDYNSGSTFASSATGETWTLNGGSHIVQRTGLYFDGSNDYLKSASFSLSQPETAYVVGNQVSWTSGDYIIDGNATNSLGVAQTTSSPQISMSAGSLVAENSDWTLKTAAVVSSVFNGASSQIRVNRGTATTGNAGAANASGFTLGAIGAATTNYGNVFISEVPVYSTAQDTATQDRVALYAGKKWKFAV